MMRSLILTTAVRVKILVPSAWEGMGQRVTVTPSHLRLHNVIDGASTLEAISKSGFSVEIKVGPSINP